MGISMRTAERCALIAFIQKMEHRLAAERISVCVEDTSGDYAELTRLLNEAAFLQRILLDD